MSCLSRSSPRRLHARLSRTTHCPQGFYDPSTDRFIEPRLTGSSYSFSADAHFESAVYLAISNRASALLSPANPKTTVHISQLTHLAPSNDTLVPLVAPAVPTRRPHPHTPHLGSSSSSSSSGSSSSNDKYNPHPDAARARRPAAQQRAVRLRDRGADAPRRRRRHIQRVCRFHGRVQRAPPARHVDLGRHAAAAAVGARRRAGHAAHGRASRGRRRRRRRKGWRDSEGGEEFVGWWRGALNDSGWRACWNREHVVLGWVGRSGRGFGLVAAWLMVGPLSKEANMASTTKSARQRVRRRERDVDSVTKGNGFHTSW